MKKTFVILLAILLVFTGCSGKDKNEEVNQQSQEEIEAERKAAEEKAELERLKAEEEKAKEEAERKAAEEARRLEEIKNSPKSPLSGLPIDEELLHKRVYAVMIDNHVDARPQSGISKAEIVYEYEAESNITRYLAFFLKNESQLIGPIRSARAYFLNTVMEYDAVLTRYGGSDDADADVYDFGINEIDGMKVASSYIWRQNDLGKVAPHNAYSSSSAIRQAITDFGYPENDAQGIFEFNLEDTVPEAKTANRLFLRFHSNGSSEFQYDENTKTYFRSVDGQPHLEEIDKTQIAAKNIIVQLVSMGYYADGVHRSVDNVGEGNGYLLTNGTVQEIIWKKADRSSKTEFLDLNNNPIKLNPGQTWVEVFDQSKEFIIE